MLTVEQSSRGALEIYFDAAGRDYLLAALAELTEPGDHVHLFSATYGGSELLEEVHHPGNRAIKQVTLGIPGPGLLRQPEEI